jgi:hypothetical protein
MAAQADRQGEGEGMSFNVFLAAQWPKCIVGPDMELHDRLSDGPPTLSDGVYFLFDGKKLVYVGKSGYVRQRIAQHRAYWRAFTHWGAVPVPHPLLDAIESAYICALRPMQNTFVPVTHEPLHDKITTAILAAWKVSATGQSSSEESRANEKVYAENN